MLNRECKWQGAEVNLGCQRTLHACRRYHFLTYENGSWSQPERVICRALANEHGSDLRYVVPNFGGAGMQYFYEVLHSGRGNVDHYRKEAKVDLASDTRSCTSKLANQFRLFLHLAAYQLLHGFRERVLVGTELALSNFGTLRLRLLKVAMRVVCKAKAINLHVPLCLAYADMWRKGFGLHLADTG